MLGVSVGCDAAIRPDTNCDGVLWRPHAKQWGNRAWQGFGSYMTRPPSYGLNCTTAFAGIVHPPEHMAQLVAYRFTNLCIWCEDLQACGQFFPPTVHRLAGHYMQPSTAAPNTDTKHQTKPAGGASDCDMTCSKCLLGDTRWNAYRP